MTPWTDGGIPEAEDRMDLASILSTTSRDKAAVLWLRWIGGYQWREVGWALNLSIPAAQSRERKAFADIILKCRDVRHARWHNEDRERRVLRRLWP